MSVNTLLKVRRGTSSEWNSANPVLSAGEWGLDTTTGRYKIGDGLTTWNSLPNASILPNSSDLIGTSGVGVSFTTTSGTPITLSVTGIYSSQMIDFNDAVDARVTAASISPEQVRDIVATGLGGGTGIYIEYDDNGTQLININVTGVSFSGHTHDDRYYTETELNTSGAGGQVHWANITSKPTGFTPVYHQHPSTDISDFNEAVQDVVGGMLVAGTGVQLSYNDGAGTVTIDTSGYALSSHTHLWSNITDASTKATLDELAYLSGVTAGTVSASRAVVVDSNKDVSALRNLTASGDVTLGTVYVTNNLSTTGNVTINGNLSVNGTTTTVESTVTKLRDPILTIGSGDNPTSDDNKDRGIEFLYHNGTSAKVGFFGFDDSTGKFTFIPDATNTSEVFSGTKGELDANVDWSNILSKPDPVITGILSGDVTGTGTVTLTDLQNGTLNISSIVLSDNTVTSAKIVDGTIVNADINDTAAIAVTKLASSGVTLGSTVVNLGQTSTVIDGLTRISGVSAASPTYIYYAVIDGGSP